MSDVEVDRDEDMSPQPHIVNFNGKDGGYLEVPPDGIPVLPEPTKAQSLPGSPQKKLYGAIMEKVEEESPVPVEAGNEVESNNSVADR